MVNETLAQPEPRKLLPETKQEDILTIDFLSVKKAANIVRAINHKLRQQLIKLIDEEKKITVTEIYVRLRLEQSVASQHLAILRKAGIVTTERVGKFIFYVINYRRVNEIDDIITNLIIL